MKGTAHAEKETPNSPSWKALKITGISDHFFQKECFVVLVLLFHHTIFQTIFSVLWYTYLLSGHQGVPKPTRTPGFFFPTNSTFDAFHSSRPALATRVTINQSHMAFYFLNLNELK